MADAMTLHDALCDEIKDLYHAEKQLVKALPKMAKKASMPELREAFESHLEETQQQVARLEEAFELLDLPAKAKTCAGMAGILEEGTEVMQGDAEDAVLDAQLIAAAQRVEHYEIAAYGTACAWAEALELTELRDLLSQSLEEEKAADEKLSALAEQGINQAATNGDDAADDRDDDSEDEELRMAAPAPSRQRGSVAASSARKTPARSGRR